jgi:hypothetical protein
MVWEITCGIKCARGEMTLHAKAFGVSDVGRDVVVCWTRAAAGHSCREDHWS